MENVDIPGIESGAPHDGATDCPMVGGDHDATIGGRSFFSDDPLSSMGMSGTDNI